jgi:hypothetical protein
MTSRGPVGCKFPRAGPAQRQHKVPFLSAKDVINSGGKLYSRAFEHFAERRKG